MIQGMSILIIQALMAVFGSYGALRALDKLHDIDWKDDVFSVLASNPTSLAIYYGVRFATVGGSMAYLCGRFVGPVQY